MNWIRSSALNSVPLLRTDALTTATISSSNIAAARVITSMWPCVTGSYEPGQTAMRGSGGMDADQRVAVAAFVFERQPEVQRGATIAFGDHRRARSQDCRQRCRQLAPEVPRQPVGRVEEHEIVLTRGRGCAAEEAASVGAADLRVGPDRFK